MLVLRAITDDEYEAFRATLFTTFGDDLERDPDGAARARALLQPGRAWATFDGATMVATAATFALTLGVPGGTMPMAGLTMVSVRPTHRRRGLMRALIERHLDDARAHGEPISGLWASQATIYGRFGFGIAAEAEDLALDCRNATVSDGRDLDDTTWIEADEARRRLPPIYARAVADRPGVLHRTPVWWDQRRFLEAPFVRGGASLRRTVVAVRDGVDVGYVVYRARGAWTDNVPSGETDIDELLAVDGRAEATLWRFVAGIDLFPRAVWDNAPVDGALPWLVGDPTRAPAPALRCAVAARRRRRRRAGRAALPARRRADLRARRPDLAPRGHRRPRQLRADHHHARPPPRPRQPQLDVPGRRQRHHPGPGRPPARLGRRRPHRRRAAGLAGAAVVPRGVLAGR
jgi:predicted N-acetyltransferase YhbS